MTAFERKFAEFVETTPVDFSFGFEPAASPMDQLRATAKWFWDAALNECDTYRRDCAASKRKSKLVSNAY